ncbi:MAG: glycosyltransferase family 39 protein [Deltaproteobacteria bacterium]|nr:glycosyltransferase family 39 protein [Deltaproteobacteria bacterium]
MPVPASAALPSRIRLAVAVALGALALYLPGLGEGDFVGDDEALDAGVVWEMQRTGDWLFPEFNGEYLPPKPPLYYWLARLAALLHGGMDEWSQRLPSALCGAATVAVTVAAVAARGGPAPAALAGSMLATTWVMRDQARLGRCDMTLTLLVTGCLLLAASPQRLRRRRGLFWSLLGLAAITKGGAGVGVVSAVVLAAALVERSADRLRALAGREAAVFAAIVAGWYGAASWHWGGRFVDEQLIGENLRHLLGGTGISDQGAATRPLAYHLGYYPRHLFSAMLPWSLLLPPALVGLWRDAERWRAERFFVVWLAAGLLFFTFASRKSPYYLLPLAPAVSIVVTAWIFPVLRASPAGRALEVPVGRRAMLGVLGVSAALWLAALWLAALAADGSCRARALASGIGGHPFFAVGALWLVLGAAVGLVASVRRRRWDVAAGSALAAVAGVLSLANRLDGPLDDCVSLRPFAREAAAAVRPDDRIFFFRLPLPAVALYAERRIPALRDPAAAPERPFFLIVPESLAGEVPADWLEDAETVVAGRGRVFTRRTMGIQLLRIGAAPATRLASAAEQPRRPSLVDTQPRRP